MVWKNGFQQILWLLSSHSSSLATIPSKWVVRHVLWEEVDSGLFTPYWFCSPFKDVDVNSLEQERARFLFPETLRAISSSWWKLFCCVCFVGGAVKKRKEIKMKEQTGELFHFLSVCKELLRCGPTLQFETQIFFFLLAKKLCCGVNVRRTCGFFFLSSLPCSVYVPLSSFLFPLSCKLWVTKS